MAYFPQPHTSQRARRFHVSEANPINIVFSDGLQIKGRLYSVSATGGCADIEMLLPVSTLIHLTFQTADGAISAVAEMLEPVNANRQPFRFLALDESDRARLDRFMGA